MDSDTEGAIWLSYQQENCPSKQIIEKRSLTEEKELLWQAGGIVHRNHFKARLITFGDH